ncbi:hypothetical protein RZS08_08620, partial [Arthrospira platensis SPKY1]|nr:hypothetical protein [Arthrospira platensis SPKY1]
EKIKELFSLSFLCCSITVEACCWRGFQCTHQSGHNLIAKSTKLTLSTNTPLASSLCYRVGTWFKRVNRFPEKVCHENFQI